MIVYGMGIDIGSAFSKGIIMGDKEVIGSYAIPSGSNYEHAAVSIKEKLVWIKAQIR